MTHPQLRVRRGGRSRRLTLATLVIAAGVGGASLPAEAAGATVMTRPADHSDNFSSGDIIGNGRYNKNLVTINSPALTRGNQAIQNANLGGSTPTVAGFCKKHHHCKFHQKIVVGYP